MFVFVRSRNVVQLSGKESATPHSVPWCPKWKCITDKPLTPVSEETRVWPRWRKWHCDMVFSGFFRIFQTSDQFRCRLLRSFHLPVDTVQNSLCLVYIRNGTLFYFLCFPYSLFLRPSVHPSIHPSFHLSIYMIVCLSVFLTFYLFFLWCRYYLFINRCKSLSVCCVDWHCNCSFYLVNGF